MADERRVLIERLAERGVNNPELLVEGLTEGELDGAFGAISFWDDMPHDGTRAVGPGLLVAKIREGGVPAYKRAHERTGAGGMGPSNALMGSIRGCLLTPDGCTRAQAEDAYRDVASRLNTPVSALIESAMGSMWVGTPTHPACSSDEPIASSARYHAWVLGHCDVAPDADCVPRAGEEEHEWACRFWSWTDPEDFEELLAAARIVWEARGRRRDEAPVPMLAAGPQPEPESVDYAEEF